LYQAYTRIQAITHTYTLHITGFILKRGSSCIRNNSRNVRLTYSFHSSCSDLDRLIVSILYRHTYYIDSFEDRIWSNAHCVMKNLKQMNYYKNIWGYAYSALIKKI